MGNTGLKFSQLAFALSIFLILLGIVKTTASRLLYCANIVTSNRGAALLELLEEQGCKAIL
jgi:hypothetical protein